MIIKPRRVQQPVPTYVASVSPETFELARAKSYSIMGALLTNSVEQLAYYMLCIVIRYLKLFAPSS